MNNYAVLGYLQLAMEHAKLNEKQKEELMASMEYAFDIMTEAEAEERYLDSM